MSASAALAFVVEQHSASASVIKDQLLLVYEENNKVCNARVLCLLRLFTTFKSVKLLSMTTLIESVNLSLLLTSTNMLIPNDRTLSFIKVDSYKPLTCSVSSS